MVGRGSGWQNSGIEKKIRNPEKNSRINQKMLNTIFLPSVQLFTQCLKWWCEETNVHECVKRLTEIFQGADTRHSWNKELFQNAPPYMIIRPSLKVGLYINFGQISKLIGKLIYIHVQLMTKPQEYYDKLVSYSYASIHKSIWIWRQIWVRLVTNTHRG